MAYREVIGKGLLCCVLVVGREADEAADFLKEGLLKVSFVHTSNVGGGGKASSIQMRERCCLSFGTGVLGCVS